MKCVHCGAPTGVVDSRLRKSGLVYRMRVCRGSRCGLRFSTREVPIDALERLGAQANGLRDVAKAIALYDGAAQAAVKRGGRG